MAVSRMAGGETVSALAREPEVRRKGLSSEPWVPEAARLGRPRAAMLRSGR